MTNAPRSRRASAVFALALAAAFALAAVAVAKPAHHRARDCAHAKHAKKRPHRAACRGTAKHRGPRVVRRQFHLSVPAGGATEGLSRVVSVRCPRHKEALGGGVEVSQPGLSVVLSVPNKAANSWLAQIANLSTAGEIDASVTVYAICA